MPSFKSVFLASALSVLVAGHGYIKSPKARVVGDAFKNKCGEQIYYNQQADGYGNIQGELQLVQDDYKPKQCNLWLCKGYQFADQGAAEIHSFKAGQKVPIVYDIHAPHGGVANVSIVDTETNTVIGKPLKKWTNYAPTSETIPASDEKFSITMPDVSSKCSKKGKCVIQHYWNAPASVDQTYESCIDFTMSGSSKRSAKFAPGYDEE